MDICDAKTSSKKNLAQLWQDQHMALSSSCKAPVESVQFRSETGFAQNESPTANGWYKIRFDGHSKLP